VGCADSAAEPVRLGSSYNNVQGWPFGGGLDDLRVYNRALTPGEVATLAAVATTSGNGERGVVL